MYPWLTAVLEKSQPYEEKKCVAVASRLSLRSSLCWAGARAASAWQKDEQAILIDSARRCRKRKSLSRMRNISEGRGA